MSTKNKKEVDKLERAKDLEKIKASLSEEEEISLDTLEELSNNKGDDDDE